MGSFRCLVPKKNGYVQRVFLMLQVPNWQRTMARSMAYKRYRSEKKRNQRRRLRKERADRIQRKFEEVLRTIYEVSTPACHGAQPATIKSSESSTKPIRTRSGRIVRPPIRWQAPCTSKRPPRKRRRNVKRQTPKITYPFPTV